MSTINSLPSQNYLQHDLLKLWIQETLKALVTYTGVIFCLLSPSIFYTFINTVSLQWHLHIHEDTGMSWHWFKGTPFYRCVTTIQVFHLCSFAHLLSILRLAVKTFTFIPTHLCLSQLHPFLGHFTNRTFKITSEVSWIWWSVIFERLLPTRSMLLQWLWSCLLMQRAQCIVRIKSNIFRKKFCFPSLVPHQKQAAQIQFCSFT